MILIDTDVALDYLHGQTTMVELVQTVYERERIAMSTITAGEIYDGVIYGRNPISAEAAFEAWQVALTIIPIDLSVARTFAALRGNLRRQGRPLADMDLLIAATALHHGLPLLTRNLRHFERVPGLMLYPTDGATSG